MQGGCAVLILRRKISKRGTETKTSRDCQDSDTLTNLRKESTDIFVDFILPTFSVVKL